MAREDAATFPIAVSEAPRPWVASYPPLVPESYPYPPVPLTRLLDDAAKDFPDSVAVDFVGHTVTYRVLLDHVDRLATALAELGVGKGDRVGVALPNCPQHVIAFFAVLRLGAVVVALDPSLDRKVLAAQINDSACRVLVVLDPVYAKVEQLKGRVPSVQHVIGTAVADYLPAVAGAWFTWRHRRNVRMVRKIPPTEGVLRFAELVHRSTPSPAAARVTPDDLAVLAYAERRRGQPRAVMLSHANLLANTFQVRLWVPDVQAGRETILCAAPFWQPFGMTAGMGLAVLSAATMALSASSDREELFSIVAKRKPTLFPATSVFVERLATAPNLRKHDLTSIRVCLVDASLLDSDVVATFEDASGGRVREGLAIAEVSGMTHANPVYGRSKPGCIGLPLSDTVCVLVDPDNPERLADGQRGHLAVHGPQVTAGYWEQPNATAQRLLDGWLLTGLLAEVDDDGYYTLVGRVDAVPPSNAATPAQR